MTPPHAPDVPVRHERALVNDVLLHYVTAGEGPPVVLLHGFPETSAAGGDCSPSSPPTTPSSRPT
jgi:pimeloyl-ACP methyl ester carboxylesterase